jgi:hypothetical protein
MEFAIHGGDQDDIEDLEGIVVGCGVSARGEEMEAGDGIFAGTEITATEGYGLWDRGLGQKEKEGEE